MITPTLENAAQLLHITPELRYLPRQKELGKFNSEIGGELVLFRERADDAWTDKKSFGYSSKIIGTDDILEKIEKNDAIIDSEEFLRARLLDLLVGDWDRHEDQWRWALDDRTVDDKMQKYRSIGRDKDQVFSHFDGWVIALLKSSSPNFLQLPKFKKELKRSDIRWMHWKSAYLDKVLLSDLSIDQWQNQSSLLKEYINDQVIDEAFDNLPESFEENKHEMADILKSRVEDIDQIANDFRKEVRLNAIVRGSVEDDKFYIEEMKDGRIHVKLVVENNESEQFIKFDDYFEEAETKDIWIYALKGNDAFYFKNMSSNKINITLLGGYGDDEIVAEGDLKNVQLIDDQLEQDFDALSGLKYQFNTDKEIFDIDRFDLVPTYRHIIPNLSYNADNGLSIGLSTNWIGCGFKTTSTHQLGLNYMTARNSSLLFYNYQNRNELTNRGNYFKSYWSGIRRQLNYFGGNASSNIENRDFYDVAMSDIMVETGINYYLNQVSQLSLGVYGWQAKVDDEEETFVIVSNSVDPEVFDQQYFGGSKLVLSLSNFDDPLIPTKGARLELSGDYKYNFGVQRSNFKLQLDYDYYKDLYKDRFIFSTKVRVGHLFGQSYFYEQFQLGGQEFLRGFFNQRFTGKSIFAQNTNLHLKLFSDLFKESFPLDFGVSGSFDYGRVWNSGDDSSAWHNNYGAGVWISPLQLVILSAGAHISEEETLLRINFGWSF